MNEVAAAIRNIEARANDNLNFGRWVEARKDVAAFASAIERASEDGSVSKEEISAFYLSLNKMQNELAA